MAHSFNFAVLRLVPDQARGESLNLGIVVFRDSGVDVRLGEVFSRARLLYPQISSDQIKEGVAIISRLGAVSLPIEERHSAISRVGIFALGDLGFFTPASSAVEAYESDVMRLIRMFTAPARTPRLMHKAPSRLKVDVRKILRHEGVLAVKGDAGAISEHKIVPEWPIPTRPSLHADLALRNGLMRVCEIVEMNLDGGAPPAVLFEGVVTLDVAQREADAAERVFAFRAVGPSTRITEALDIAQIHATKLVNWEAPQERDDFLHEWITAAKTKPRGNLAA